MPLLLRHRSGSDINTVIKDLSDKVENNYELILNLDLYVIPVFVQKLLLQYGILLLYIFYIIINAL